MLRHSKIYRPIGSVAGLDRGVVSRFRGISKEASAWLEFNRRAKRVGVVVDLPRGRVLSGGLSGAVSSGCDPIGYGCFRARIRRSH